MTTKQGAGSAGIGDGSPMQTFFLARLQHLMEQRGRYADLVGPEDWRLKLISRALYSSFRDLSELGLADEARNILERGRALHRN